MWWTVVVFASKFFIVGITKLECRKRKGFFPDHSFFYGKFEVGFAGKLTSKVSHEGWLLPFSWQLDSKLGNDFCGSLWWMTKHSTLSKRLK